jgi:hypothetical protein
MSAFPKFRHIPIRPRCDILLQAASPDNLFVSIFPKQLAKDDIAAHSSVLDERDLWGVSYGWLQPGSLQVGAGFGLTVSQARYRVWTGSRRFDLTLKYRSFAEDREKQKRLPARKWACDYVERIRNESDRYIAQSK